MRTIFKYALNPGTQEIMMPRGARLLTVQTQDYKPQLWALVDTEQPDEVREFAVVGTGHPMPEDSGEYVGTFQLVGLGLVLHVFAASTGR